jgi:5'(3')-deoxyribonucleotidase
MLKPFAIDLDDVIGPLSAVMCPALNALSGMSMAVSEWHRYDIYNVYGVNYDQFVDCIISNQLLEKMPICPTASKALKAIRAASHPVVILTKRGYHPDADEITRDWLARNGAPYDDLIIVPDGTKVVKTTCLAKIVLKRYGITSCLWT